MKCLSLPPWFKLIGQLLPCSMHASKNQSIINLNIYINSLKAILQLLMLFSLTIFKVMAGMLFFKYIRHQILQVLCRPFQRKRSILVGHVFGHLRPIRQEIKIEVFTVCSFQVRTMSNSNSKCLKLAICSKASPLSKAAWRYSPGLSAGIRFVVESLTCIPTEAAWWLTASSRPYTSL